MSVHGHPVAAVCSICGHITVDDFCPECNPSPAVIGWTPLTLPRPVIRSERQTNGQVKVFLEDHYLGYLAKETSDGWWTIWKYSAPLMHSKLGIVPFYATATAMLVVRELEELAGWGNPASVAAQKQMTDAFTQAMRVVAHPG